MPKERTGTSLFIINNWRQLTSGGVFAILILALSGTLFLTQNTLTDVSTVQDNSSVKDSIGGGSDLPDANSSLPNKLFSNPLANLSKNLGSNDVFNTGVTDRNASFGLGNSANDLKPFLPVPPTNPTDENPTTPGVTPPTNPNPVNPTPVAPKPEKGVVGNLTNDLNNKVVKEISPELGNVVDGLDKALNPVVKPVDDLVGTLLPGTKQTPNGEPAKGGVIGGLLETVDNTTRGLLGKGLLSGK